MAQVSQWGHSLFGCFDDIGTCVLAFIAPCVVFGRNAEAVGEGTCLTCGLAYAVPILNILMALNVRGSIREERKIEGSTINDCLVISCCAVCSLIQESQELKGNAPAAMCMSRE